MPPSSSSPAATAGSVADRPGARRRHAPASDQCRRARPGPARRRSPSAAWSSPRPSPSSRSSPRSRSSGSSRAAGYAPFAALGTVLALVVVLDAAFPQVLEGSGLLLGRDRDRPRRRSRRSPGSTRATASGLDGDRLRRPLRRAAVVHHPARPGGAGRARPALRCSALGARARLDPAAGPRGLVVRHGRLPRRQELRADASS